MSNDLAALADPIDSGSRRLADLSSSLQYSRQTSQIFCPERLKGFLQDVKVKPSAFSRFTSLRFAMNRIFQSPYTADCYR